LPGRARDPDRGRAAVNPARPGARGSTSRRNRTAAPVERAGAAREGDRRRGIPVLRYRLRRAALCLRQVRAGGDSAAGARPVRYVLAGMILLALLRFSGRKTGIGGRDLPAMFGLGLVGVALNQVGYTAGLDLTSGSNGALIFATAPIWGLLGRRRLLDHIRQRLRHSRLAGERLPDGGQQGPGLHVRGYPGRAGLQRRAPWGRAGTGQTRGRGRALAGRLPRASRLTHPESHPPGNAPPCTPRRIAG
jgi:hypothetical protein